MSKSISDQRNTSESERLPNAYNSCRNIAISLIDPLVMFHVRPKGVVGVIAFHEKAGRSQVGSVFFVGQDFSSRRVGHCRHASIRTLEERIISLGACWAFSVQPVLLSVWRPVALLVRVEPGPGN